MLAKCKDNAYNPYPETLRCGCRIIRFELNSHMRRLLATALYTALGLALPVAAWAQLAPPPVIAALPAKPAAKAHPARHDAKHVVVTAHGATAATAPGRSALSVGGQTHLARTGVAITARPGITAHAAVEAVRWAPLVPACAAAIPGAATAPACLGLNQAQAQRGEVGATFAGRNVKLDLAIGQERSVRAPEPVRPERGALPRVLPGPDGADVAAPLWFSNSTATDIRARGQVRLAPDTHVEVGASVGRVHFLPAAGLGDNDTFDQATLGFGIQHGAVRGAIVGHVLEPSIPGSGFDQSQRWGGIDLGISVRLPWRGELNFGAQNVWTSGHAPLLFGTGNGAQAQGRVPYVQYHQDL